MNLKIKLTLIILLFNIVLFAQGSFDLNGVASSKSEKTEKKYKNNKFKLPNIDLSHWSITTPEPNKKGNATTIDPPEILNYATDPRLIPYMYNDSIDGSLVFRSMPTSATTGNTKFSRSEIREQLVSGNNDVNWTFKQGGKMKGRLAMSEVSKDKEGNYHKVIIMQIHGRLTDQQRDLIGQKDNNAPPVLKIYWQDGKVRVKTKELKNLDVTNDEMLHESAWVDDQGYTFKEAVGFNSFILEVEVSEGKIVVSLNNSEFQVYENIHLKKWGIFENYFKAGNYFQSRDEGAFAKVKYYNLTVSH